MSTTEPNHSHDHSHETETREREVIVTDNGGGSSLATAVIAILAIVAVLFFGWMFLNESPDGGDGGSVVPEEMDVNVDTGSGGDEG